MDKDPPKALPKEISDFITQSTTESMDIGFMKGADTVLKMVDEVDITLSRLIRETLSEKFPPYVKGKEAVDKMKKHFDAKGAETGRFKEKP